jgi:hypothetical protein
MLILNFKVSFRRRRRKKKHRTKYVFFSSDIKMDWSSPGEILAVGGHKRSNESTYINQIIFYTRRGEFLHRVHIPQTVGDFFE